MKNEQLSGGNAAPLVWHPAFLQAIQIELFDYRDSLEFKSEFQLTTAPLRIDLLIIKKPKELIIEKNIARIFRTDNLLEYKSPDDYLSVKDFIKVYAYANLYTAITPGVELSDVTITFVESKYPRKLIKYLTNERGYTVQQTSPGIYQVLGDYIPIQIIESKKLSESENLWLKSLRNDLEIRNADGILKETKQWQEKMPLDAYFDILLRANRNAFLEVIDMKTAPTLESILTEAGLLPKWIAQGKTEGKAEGKAEVARNLFAKGMSIEEIAQVTELPFEKVHALALG